MNEDKNDMKPTQRERRVRRQGEEPAPEAKRDAEERTPLSSPRERGESGVSSSPKTSLGGNRDESPVSPSRVREEANKPAVEPTRAVVAPEPKAPSAETLKSEAAAPLPRPKAPETKRTPSRPGPSKPVMTTIRSEKKIKAGIRMLAVVLTAVALISVPVVEVTQADVTENLLMLIPLDEILVIRERKKPKPKPLPVKQHRKAPRSTPSPVIQPTEMEAAPSPIVVAEPSLEEPEFGPVHEIFEPPPEERPPTKLEPVASPLPDIVMRETVSDEARPPAGIPANVQQRGEVFRGAGEPNLEPSDIPTYTGPNLDFPETETPTIGLSRGQEVAATTDVPGVARGEKYTSKAGKAPGPGTSESLLPSEDLLGEDELAGLLAWLRNHPGQFPRVLESYMETSTSDLKGVTSYRGWDIFIQFSEDEHQLKLFLSQGGTGILLADSDFKRRSQLFGTGSVSRAGSQLSAIAAQRDKPTTESTAQFYSVFQGWMQSQGISLEQRAQR